MGGGEAEKECPWQGFYPLPTLASEEAISMQISCTGLACISNRALAFQALL